MQVATVVDGDTNGIRIRQRATAARVALVVGNNLQSCGAAKAVGRRESHPLQGRVDVRQRTGKGHRRIGDPISDSESQSGALSRARAKWAAGDAHSDHHIQLQRTGRDRVRDSGFSQSDDNRLRSPGN